MFHGRLGGAASILKSWIFRATNIPAGVALLVVGILGVVADLQNRTIYEQEMRAKVADRLSVVRAKLEGKVTADLQLVQGLAAAIATWPGMTQERFATLAGTLFETGSNLRILAAAPDLKVRLIFPLAGNERVLGLDYMTVPEQRAGVLRARDTGRPVLSGPIKLVQGGEGLVARFPVYTPQGDGSRAFWGVVSAVVDMDLLYRTSGLKDPSLSLDVALAGRDGVGEDVFFGNPAILEDAPLTTEVHLPTGMWRLSAVPKGGWQLRPPNTGALHLLIGLAALAVVGPMLVTGHLYAERRGHVEELSRRGAALERLSNRLKIALEASQVGVWEMDMESNQLVWDDRMYELYGRTRRIGGLDNDEAWKSCLHPEDYDRAVADFTAALASRKLYRSEFRVLLPDGQTRTVRAVGSVCTIEGRDKIVGVNWDVTHDVERSAELQRAKVLAEARNEQLQAANRRIEHASLHDALTGLPNRRFLASHLATLQGGAAGRRVAVLHMDLDRFKQINDTLGHRTGDAMLLHAASLMRSVFRDEDFVARIGGDEFVAVCLDADVERLAAELAERLVSAMRQPVVFEGHSCRLGLSVGIACADGAALGMGSDKLLINADIALYRAKNLGRSRFEFFTDDTEAEVVQAKRMADEMLTGLEEGQFVPYYQPQYDARTRKLVGAEALARWMHPREGMLTPDRFLKVAEEMDLLSAIDRAILKHALADMAGWRAQGLEVPRLAVNVSLKRLHDQGLADELRALSVPPGTLTFELVESIYLDDANANISWNIERLRALGIGIEIDDFGTGHASIVSLINLRPDRLKIDRQLTAAVVTSRAQRQLVRSIVEIGQAMDIGIVAEGVETLQHADVLRDIGCDVLQGYAFSRPVDAERFVHLLATDEEARSA